MSTADTAPPPTERSTRILEAACRVIVREGAHGLRMASVAEEADVSKALVHYYFATRQELLRNAFAFSEQRWQAAIDAELATVSTGAARVERMLLVERRAGPRLQRAARARQRGLEQPALRRGAAPARRALATAPGSAASSTLIEEGKADGSIAADVDAASAGWRLAAAADGLDSLLYLGLVDRDEAAADARDDRPRAGGRRRLTDVLVLGAGLAGLAAARDLAAAAPTSPCSRRGSGSAGASSSSASTTAARCSSAARSSGRSTPRTSASSRSSA